MSHEKQFKKLVITRLARMYLGKFVHPHEERNVQRSAPSNLLFPTGWGASHAVGWTRALTFHYSSVASIKISKGPFPYNEDLSNLPSPVITKFAS